VEQVLVGQQHAQLGKAARGLVRRYIEKMTALSRAQVTRLTAGHTASRRVQVTVYRMRRIPMAHGFIYPAAVVDWFSRRVLVWKLSITMETSFCIEALEEALSKNEKPEIFNNDQGSQSTSEVFTGRLKKEGIRISMDGRGHWRDNVFIERV
jgi:putative transposase